MCTLSWLKTQDGYEIFFNRDEQRSRSIASIPELYNTPSGNQFIMPTDLDSGGSWIGLTETGISVCLLNFYQGVTPNSILISRGLLVKNLLSLNNLDEMLNKLSRMALDCYAPFTLAIFDPEQDQPICFCWDGVTFTEIKIKSPYTSSGVEFPQVSHARQQTFRQHFKDRPKCIDQLKAFHRSHLPEKSKWSVCMHREDASTVSFSHLSINPFNSVFHYVAGSPCQQDAQQTSHDFNRNNLMSKSA